MSRKPIVFGNWKLNKSLKESVEFIRALDGRLEGLDVDAGIAPVTTVLESAVAASRNSKLAIAGQDVHWCDSGAYTGTVSGNHLLELGCSHVIIGHSERRQFFMESDDRVSDKVRLAFDVGLTPIACIGETLAQREAGHAEKIVARQVSSIVSQLTADEVSRLVLAYEPVWAIGTGKSATPEDADHMHLVIRNCVRKQFDDAADTLRIQYGGSVKPANAESLLSMPNIDGALVGGASLKVDSFLEILKWADSTRS